MSNTNYDVELPITYDDAYKHYIPTYRVHIPAFSIGTDSYGTWYRYYGFVNLDDKYADTWCLIPTLRG